MIVSGSNVLEMLCPNIEWSIVGFDYDSIDWFCKAPLITKAQFDQGFLDYPSWKATQEQSVVDAKKIAMKKLNALGLNTTDLQALGL